MKFLLLSLLFLAAAVQSVLAQDPEYTYRSNATDALTPPEWPEVYEHCGGSKQSPIDITESKLCNVYVPPTISFAGSCPNYNMTETSESYKAAEIALLLLMVRRTTMPSSTCILHPSTLSTETFDGEIHFVHKNLDDSAALVVGLFLESNDEPDTEPTVNVIVDAMSDVTLNTSVPIALGSYSKLLGAYIDKGHVFNYAGSLTTPPCIEIVDWWVIRTPVRISSAQFDRIKSNLAELEVTDAGKNARPVQPLNGRTVLTYN